MEKEVSLEDMVRTVAPHFAYQLQFANDDLEKVFQSKAETKQFLSALYGGRTEKGEFGFEAEKGILLDKVMQLRPSRLMSEEVSISSCFF
jgi:hypothetical protein